MSRDTKSDIRTTVGPAYGVWLVWLCIPLALLGFFLAGCIIYEMVVWQ